MDFNYLNGFTVMTWIKVTDFVGCEGGCPVFGRMHFADPTFGDMGYLVSIRVVDGEPRWQFTTANGVHMSTSTMTYAREPITADRWYHVAISFHRVTLFSGKKLLCVDGQCETQATDSGLIGYVAPCLVGALPPDLPGPVHVHALGPLALTPIPRSYPTTLSQSTTETEGGGGGVRGRSRQISRSKLAAKFPTQKSGGFQAPPSSESPTHHSITGSDPPEPTKKQQQPSKPTGK